MNTVSIGYVREDGDLQLLATLNNVDENLTQDQFSNLVERVIDHYRKCGLNDVEVYERADVPDYVELEEQTV